MTDDLRLSAHERVLRVLDHLGVARAHLAGRHPHLIGDLAGARTDLAASATLVCPPAFDTTPLRRLEERVLVVLGDRGAAAESAGRAVADLPAATIARLPDYETQPWSDMVADHAGLIGDALLALLDRVTARDGLAPAGLEACEGEVAGVSYRVGGAGPPLVLFPLGLSPSQWDPLLAHLAERYCTILLGGAHFGIVSTLEERGRTPGYLGVVADVVDALGLRPGARVLEVGCGTGVLCRWLARRTAGANPIVGLDLNRYMLREAADLAAREGLAAPAPIDFREGDALALPFADGSFDAALSVTVLEEVDADRALAEMARVVRPGGRVGVVVRAVDVPFWYNLPLDAAIKARAERVVGPGVGPAGCADGALAGRVRRAGLADARAWLQIATLYPGRDTREMWGYYQSWVLATLDDGEAAAWRAAVAKADADGTIAWGLPFHCAVGTRP